MNRIDRYIASHHVLGSILVLLLLLSLFSFLALAEELEDVGKATYRTIDAFLVVAYTLPKRIVELLPVTLLLGGLIGIGVMANHREIVAIRVAGYSPQRIAWPIVQVGLLTGLLVLILQHFGIPVWEQRAAQLRAKATVQAAASDNDESFWTRTGSAVIHVEAVLYGRSPRNIEIYELDQQGIVNRLIEAGSADVIGSGKWLLRDVRSNDLTGERVREQRMETLQWHSDLSAEQISQLLMPIDALAPGNLFQYIRYLEDNRMDAHQYRLILWQQVGVPISILAMCMLGVPFVMGSTRTISAGQRVAIGGGIGILFYLGEQITSHLAALFDLSPAPAALAPDFTLLVIAVFLLWRLR